MKAEGWRLIATGPSASSQVAIAIDATELIVGRGPDSQLRLASTSVSKTHARLLARESGLWVEDLGSRNGVFINGGRIEETSPLRHGDVLNFATEGFLVECVNTGSTGAETLESPSLETRLAAEIGRREMVERLLDEAESRLSQSCDATELARLAADRLMSFGAILDESDNEFYIFDCETLRFLHVNRGARKNLRYSMEELRSITPIDIKPEFTAAEFEKQIRPLRDGLTSTLQFATVHQRKDGSRYPVSVHLHRSTFDRREVFVAVILDTTEQVKAQEEIRKLSAAVEQSPAAVVITDLDRNVTYANATFSVLTGYGDDEARSLDSRRFLGGDLTDDQYSAVWSTARAGRVWRGEFLNRKKCGEQFWESASVSPIRSIGGEVTHYLIEFQDVSQQRADSDRMETLAFSDALTGLPNRVALLEAVQEAIDENDTRFALLFLDFDRFKLINDSLGHEMGDELLRQISQRLRASLRLTDAVMPARLGGDEFVVLLRDLSEPGAALSVAERLSSAFAKSYQLGGNTVYSTASIGVVNRGPQHTSACEMLRDADLAMYEAKSRGKGLCVAFDPTMHERVQGLLQMECGLRQALSNNELFVEYQPIVSLETGALDGLEALVRWRHPELGIVSPDRFIPVAEETGLIVPIGEFVLEEVCRRYGDWQENPCLKAPRGIHVNVSRVQMLLPNMAEITDAVLRKHSVPHDRLHLEVTESTIMHDPDTVVATMDQLKSLGVRIDMDDFGTGYSSLACLHEFPIDVLKIDRSFINSERHAREHVALLQAIVALAESLDLQVVGEGVETVEQVAMLQTLGCHFGQGYYFSKPLSPEAVESLLRQESESSVGNADRLPSAATL